MTSESEKILDDTTELLKDSLGLWGDEDTEITLSSTIMENLGAESIDFLDIRFRISKKFGITLTYPDDFPNIKDQTVNTLCQAICDKLKVPWIPPVHANA